VLLANCSETTSYGLLVNALAVHDCWIGTQGTWASHKKKHRWLSASQLLINHWVHLSRIHNHLLLAWLHHLLARLHHYLLLAHHLLLAWLHHILARLHHYLLLAHHLLLAWLHDDLWLHRMNLAAIVR
jgi:hypothetical protein